MNKMGNNFDFIYNVPYIIQYLLIASFFWGVVCSAIGRRNKIKGCFLWGFLLRFIGFIVVLVMCLTNGRENENKYEQLEKLSKLKNSGAISEEEFETEKRKILKK